MAVRGFHLTINRKAGVAYYSEVVFSAKCFR